MITRIIRGAKYNEKYGHHPGWTPLFLFTLLGFISGAARGFYGAMVGGFGMLIFIGIPFLMGCYDRGEAATGRTGAGDEPR